MAPENGRTSQHLDFLRRAAEQARRFGLFGLLRAAEARAADLPRIGDARLPAQNLVDLAQTPALGFPGSTLDSITVNGGRARVQGYWLGLTGPMGPLPLHMTEFAHYERRYAKKHPFGRFLDVLAGRMLQFFYRAWAESNPAANADRPRDDRFASYLAALTGAADGVREDAAFPARARLYYAGLYASRRSAAGIEDAVADLVGSPVRLIEYQPRWRDIEPADQTRLGGAFSQLGGDAVCGRRVSTVSDAYRIAVHVDTYRAYEDLMPGGPRFAVVAEALDSFAPSHLEWDLEVEVSEAAMRPTTLDGRARLGWTSWMNPPLGCGPRAETRLGPSARRIARNATKSTTVRRGAA
ncbi:type VI secretion system baseplate subunit TssG [Caulobacter sp. 1776]|uniref:type VI secretion system baseplate subunit TssG n=1 Tax=Caulobacter sp. 1776 TaxID=3156420 RepID=UPI0033947615